MPKLTPLRDYTVKVSIEEDGESISHTVYFNFCTKALTQCTLEDGSKSTAQAILKKDDDETCKTLTLPVADDSFDINESLIFSSDNPDQATGLRLLYNNTGTSLATGNYFNF